MGSGSPAAEMRQPGYETSGGVVVDVCVLGLGTLGRATAALLARAGLRVHGVDTDAERIRGLAERKDVQLEPGLSDLLAVALQAGLEVGTTPVSAEAYIVAVPTPLDRDRAPDVAAVWSAVESLREVAPRGALVVIESTCPVGTAQAIAATTPGLLVATCPERALPGDLLGELTRNDRLIGGVTVDAAEAAAALYRRFVDGALHLTDARTAELAKLVENASRAVQVSFANEVALIADSYGVDPWVLRALVNRHPRVDILRPGPGIGGHCLPVDPWFLVCDRPQQTGLIAAAARVDEARREAVVERVCALAEHREGPIACLGLTYKPDVADVRESAALDIVRRLLERLGERIRVADPYAPPLAGVDTVSTDEAVGDAALVVVLVAHRAFRGLVIEAEVLDVAGVFA